ncbi:MAG TPA: 4-hydroxy-3-methylbut-2-enyl diphosphate reductase, partial [Acidobacteriota bacterium]|nr:4-hydroxy-3-methylbut-2-enyl diphosphate reductase [Acidobacteriota bacterium]
KTICAHTIRNQDSSAELARTVDVMIVVGSKHSSNSNKLFDKCATENPNTLFIQRLSELDPGRFGADMTVGITSGASTPDWIVDEIAGALEAI